MADEYPGVIDAHHHLWPAEAVADQAWQPPGGTPLRRAFEPDDLREDLRRAGVDGTVLMQSVDDAAENERLLAYAAGADFVRGVVAWAPLDRSDRAREVVDDLTARAAAGAPVVGVRCLVGTDPMAWARSAEALEVFRRLAGAGLAWDAVPVTDAQRDAVVAVAEAVPDLRVVVDHLAAPPLDEAGLGPWRSGLRRLAEAPGVAIKLSVGVAVLTRAERWSTPQVAGWVRDALEVFGPQRSMVASNWPVVLLRADYALAWDDVVAVVRAAVPAPDAGAVLGGTAARWYRLGGGRG